MQLVSEPSWFTVRHLLEVLGALILIASAIGAWAVVLRRRAKLLGARVVHQKAWITRSMVVARERSRILELISSSQQPEDVLTEICETGKRLLPGVDCAHDVQFEKWLWDKTDKPTIEALEKTLFDLPLPGLKGQSAGRIVLSAPAGYVIEEDHDEVIAVLTELANLTMQQALLYQGLVHHSTHDPLTELPNRRLFESRLASALSEAEQQNGQLAVIYIDVNRFKEVNDKHGHKTGDLYLQQIGHRLQGQIRTIDMLARIGGDEFVVIAPFSEGVDRAEALRARLQACFN